MDKTSFNLLVAIFCCMPLCAQKMPDKTYFHHTTTNESALHYLVIKTNLAAWAGSVMNMAVDAQVSRHISIELPVLRLERLTIASRIL